MFARKWRLERQMPALPGPRRMRLALALSVACPQIAYDDPNTDRWGKDLSSEDHQLFLSTTDAGKFEVLVVGRSRMESAGVVCLVTGRIKSRLWFKALGAV
jgi:hypothetical protein